VNLEESTNMAENHRQGRNKYTLRCSKCEGYDNETHQCPKWNATPSTNRDLKHYMLYLKKEKEKTLQKLDVLKRGLCIIECIQNVTRCVIYIHTKLTL